MFLDVGRQVQREGAPAERRQPAGPCVEARSEHHQLRDAGAEGLGDLVVGIAFAAQYAASDPSRTLLRRGDRRSAYGRQAAI
nr:hypothetical protein [Nonomuraea zeae]